MVSAPLKLAQEYFRAGKICENTRENDNLFANLKDQIKPNGVMLL
jgi:hypothetical protein